MNSSGDALADADEVLFVLTLCQTVFINRVGRPSNSTCHLTEATSRDMLYYMVQNAMQRPLKHFIQCFQNWTNLPTNIFAVSHFLKITQIIVC